MRQRIVGLGSAIAGTPVANRRSGFRDQKASMWGRVIALGFLLGLASSIAIWVYDKWLSQPTPEQSKSAHAGI
jgi:hypothetical protein